MAATWGALFRAFLPVRVLKGIVVKIFLQPAQDSETVEGSSIDDFHDAASDHSVYESPETGDIEGHRGSTHNIQQEEKSKLHLHPEGEAREGGDDDTSKEMVVMTFQQQRRDPEMIEEDGVDDYNVALGFSIRGHSVRAHRGLTHDIVEVDKIKLHPDTTGDAQEEGHYGTLTPIEGCQVIDQHLAQHPLSLKNSSLRGKKRAITTDTCEQKKRQRCKNWIGDETEQLVNLRLESLRNEGNVGRFGKNKRNEPVWEAISRRIPGRTPEQCQNRWDTVVRSFKAIDGHKKRFSQVTVRDFQKMKVAPYFRSAEWYKMFDDQREVWDLSVRGKGRGSCDMKGVSVAAGVPALPTTGSLNLDAFHPEMVTRTSPSEQSGSTLATCETPTLQEKELASATRILLVILRRRDPQRKVTKPLLTLINQIQQNARKPKALCNYQSKRRLVIAQGLWEVWEQIPRLCRRTVKGAFLVCRSQPALLVNLGGINASSGVRSRRKDIQKHHWSPVKHVGDTKSCGVYGE